MRIDKEYLNNLINNIYKYNNKFNGNELKYVLEYLDYENPEKEQSQILNSREELLSEIEKFKKKYPNEKNVPRPKHWSGWRLSPVEIEFWLDGRSRIHERLKYIKKQDKDWERVLLNP